MIFQDPIDKYQIDQYIKGVKQLFDAEKSHVDLVDIPQTTDSDKNVIDLKFKEKLTFNIPFRPYVLLSGHVEYTRDPETGLIVYSHEYWDKSVSDVYKSLKF